MATKRLLHGFSKSKCCGHETLLVRSRKHGFVSQDCLKCGESDYVNELDLPDLACDKCAATMAIGKDRKHNYVYECDACQFRFVLADILIHWDERFTYSGLAVDSDQWR